MKNECGTTGMIGWNNQRATIDQWSIDRETQSVRIYCDVIHFTDTFGVVQKEVVNAIGDNWLIRADHESGVYYGSAICTGVAFPNLYQPSPKLEHFPNTLALYFDFLHDDYGPHHIACARAMARNGNDMFFDLLPLREIENRFASNDIRFLQYQPSR